MARYKPSAPMKLLSENNLLIGRILDYGCGKGFDANFYKLESYDPYYQPNLPEGKFDTITCLYVLNVVEKIEELQIIEKIRSILNKNGKAYFSVRRDDFYEGINKHGLLQRRVFLEGYGFKIIKQCKSYALYEMVME